MRYTKKFINARFEIAMKAAGLAVGKSYVDGKAQIGVCNIDYAAIYGGYTIRMIANASGGESSPFGQERYKASEFVALLTGIIYTADIINARRV